MSHGGGEGEGEGEGGGEAHRSMAFKADDYCVDVVLVKLRREVGAGALRVLQRIADAQVGCGAQPGDGNIHRSTKA